MTLTQKEIADSFDKIYKRKRFNYLRPSEAYEIFISILSPQKGSKCLDVGSGLGLLLKLMVKKGLLAQGVDISQEAVKISQSYCPEAEVYLGNAEELPFENNEFQYITCIGSMERMINREKVILEQKRVATDNARFCYMVRNSNHYSWRWLLKPFNLYNRKAHQDALNYQEWSHLFKSCGLRILAVYPDHWPYYRLRRYIPIWRRNIDYSKIRKFPFRLDRAYEFIFLLEKDG
jgi:ubiquinone/menaquinone biosynthesis C-methylase UbiE